MKQVAVIGGGAIDGKEAFTMMIEKVSMISLNKKPPAPCLNSAFVHAGL